MSHRNGCRKWRADLALCSISGGTDIISCFALGNPLLPVYRGELQCFGLGMDVQTWNDDGSKSNVGQQWQDDVRLVLFVVLSKEALASGLHNNGITDELRQKIRQQIRANCTPRHVPAKVIAVPELPRTISGKLVELAVRNVVHGDPVKNTDALANPQALAHFKDIEELGRD